MAWDISEFSHIEVVMAAKILPNGKAPGPDGIPNEVLKAAVEACPNRVTSLFNVCIKSAHYLLESKTANLVLLPKPENTLYNPAVYRPLCMLNTTGKLFKKLHTRRL